nr:MAG TPA: hypothetical protein [Caudoviricetes sp.]
MVKDWLNDMTKDDMTIGQLLDATIAKLDKNDRKNDEETFYSKVEKIVDEMNKNAYISLDKEGRKVLIDRPMVKAKCEDCKCNCLDEGLDIINAVNAKDLRIENARAEGFEVAKKCKSERSIEIEYIVTDILEQIFDIIVCANDEGYDSVDIDMLSIFEDEFGDYVDDSEAMQTIMEYCNDVLEDYNYKVEAYLTLFQEEGMTSESTEEAKIVISW